MNHLDLIKASQPHWQDYTDHSFVHDLATGSLAKSAFLHYLQQDFLFLKHYARAYALAIYKSTDLLNMRRALPSLYALLDSEITHHVNYCAQWGINEAEMEAEPEAFGTVAYTRYVLDVGMSGDLVDLYVALAPCSLGYAEIGRQQMQAAHTRLDGNPYRSWLEMYAGEEFQQAVAQGRDYLDELLAPIALDSPQGQRLCAIFSTATRMEVAFWQQGLDCDK